MQISNIGFWESWSRSQSINRKRVGTHVGEALSSLLLWQHTLHKIEGKTRPEVHLLYIYLFICIVLGIKQYCLALLLELLTFSDLFQAGLEWA